MSLAEPESRRLMSLVQLKGTSVSYASRTVLQNIHWSLEAGQSVLVVGPSGCGKSTLAMLMAGIIPRSVEAAITGSVWRHPRLERSGAIGYVFQDPDSQFCQIRAGEEVAFGLENRAINPEQMDERIDEALQKAHLRISWDIEHSILSGGNKQKLAIASALALEPELMILDEPTANLDPSATDQVFQEIAKLVESGKGVFVIEHKFEQLAQIMPFMLLMGRDGQIHRFGRTHELIEQEGPWMREQGLIAEKRSGQRPTHLRQNTVVQLSGVSSRYGRNQGPLVLKGIDLSVHGGELVALVGANGAGKSTLLKVMAGLMKSASGTVERPSMPEIAFGFQNPEHQFIFERVADELANRYLDEEISPDVKRLLEEFQLGNMATLSPYALSQGQKRRLSVAVMVQREHQLYVLDEPTFGQDAETRGVIMDRLTERARQGAAVVISTHDMSLVEMYANRVVTIDGGEIIFDGDYAGLQKRLDVLRRAHLVAGVDAEEGSLHRPSVFNTLSVSVQKSPMGRLNPAWKLFSVFTAVGLTVFVHTLAQAIGFALIPLILLVALSGLTLRSVLKRLAPFIIFFMLYTWMMTAYARVGPTTPIFHLLWYRLSYPGFIKGVILAFRMLSAVAFGLFFVSTVDLVDLVKSLSREFHVPPRFSYGTLAGLRFFPQFQEEWGKLTLARRIRGREARWSVNRIVTYALPLLSDAVRLSERVAIAMEARGFVGAVTKVSAERTYYRPSVRSWRDLLFFVILMALGILILWR